MLDKTTKLDDTSIGGLIARAADDAKRVVHAEVSVQVETVKARLVGVKLAAPFLAVALLLTIAAVTVLVFALGDLLAIWAGPAGGHAMSAVIALVLAGLLAWLGARNLSPASDNAESTK